MNLLYHLMEGKKSAEKKNIHKYISSYMFVEVILVFLFPVVSGYIEKLITNDQASLALFGKWFVFWAFGLPLFILGIKQTSNRSLAIAAGKQTHRNRYDIVRKSGIANICLGVGGILSLINENWRQIVAILGCLFFCLAMLSHFTSKLSSAYEKFMMIKDSIIFLILLSYIIYTLKQFR